MTAETSHVTLEGAVTIIGTLSGLPEPTTTIIHIGGGSLLPGTPLPLPGSTLPPNYKWADRSVVLFADWPDLKDIYDAGLLDVLPANATDAEKSAHPRKWVLNGCNNGLFLPDIGGRFAREWRPEQKDDAGRQAGTRQGDAIRNITASLLSYLTGYKAQGAFVAEMHKDNVNIQGTPVPRYGTLKFDASLVVPTADENRPLNDAQPVAIYMGRRSEELE